MPASSAASLHRDDDVQQDAQVDRVERVVGSAGTNAAVGGTTAFPLVNNSFRIKDTRKIKSVAAHPQAKRTHSEIEGEGEIKRENSTLRPCTTNAASHSSLSQGKTSIAHRSTTATESQRLKGLIEAFEADPPSNQLIQLKMESSLPDRSVANLPPMPMALNEIMSIEDFEKQHPYSPPLLKNGIPRRTVNPVRLDANYGIHTAALHAAAQERGLIPRIDTPQVAEGCFKAILIVDNQVIEQLTDVYASKRDAKEELCRRALPTVCALENKKKRKSTSTEIGDGYASAPGDLDEENWLGILIRKLLSSHVGDIC